MATGFSEDYRSVECPVCLTSMIDRSPRALSCLHTFCEPCLLQCAGSRDYVNCPTCRQQTKLPETGVSGLPVNFYIQQLSARKKRACKPCQNCMEAERDPTQAMNFCKNCELYLCDACSCRHKTIPSFTHHQVEILELPANYALEVSCNIHKKEITTYCKICDKFICDRCAMGVDHEGHEAELEKAYLALENMKDSIKPGLSSLMTDLNETMDGVAKGLRQLNSIKAQIRQEGKRRIDKINEEMKHLIASVERDHEAELLTKQSQISQALSGAEKLTTILEMPNPKNSEQLNLVKRAGIQLDELKSMISHLSKGNKNIEFSAAPFNIEFGKVVTGALLTPTASNKTDGQLVRKKEDRPRKESLCSRCKEKMAFPFFLCGMCASFQLCIKCETNMRKRNDHQWDHPFLKIYEDSKIPTKRPAITGQICRGLNPWCLLLQVNKPNLPKCHGCGKMPLDMVLKCGYCESFYLCYKCEGDRTFNRRHPPDHVFITMTIDRIAHLIRPKEPLLGYIS